MMTLKPSRSARTIRKIVRSAFFGGAGGAAAFSTETGSDIGEVYSTMRSGIERGNGGPSLRVAVDSPVSLREKSVNRGSDTGVSPVLTVHARAKGPCHN